jgi:hypothetical protein
MSGIVPDKREVFISEFANLVRQMAGIKPEAWRGKMVQSGVHLPASKSSSAFFPAASNRPARMSASI